MGQGIEPYEIVQISETKCLIVNYGRIFNDIMTIF